MANFQQSKSEIVQHCELFFSNLKRGVALLTESGDVEFANNLAHEQLKLSLLPQSSKNLLDSEMIKNSVFTPRFQATIQNSNSIRFELKVEDPVYLDTLWFDCTMKLVQTTTEKFVLVFTDEITERKLFEEDIAKLNMEINTQNLEYLAESKKVSHLNKLLKQRELELIVEKKAAEEANRLKSIFLTNMSHEIRTPMNAILGYARILKKNIKNQIATEQLEIIQKSGKGLLGLINSILDLSKIEAGKFRLNYATANFKSLLKEIENMFLLRSQEKGIFFSLEYQHDIPPFLIIDDSQIRQILINLIGNSIKFTNEGFVKVQFTHTINEPEHKLNLKIKIEDSGIGIPSDQIDKIFQPFTQQSGIETKYGGTGLGLTITQRLVNLMKGTIEVESELNKGTIFKIMLPDIEISKEKSTEPDKELLNNIEFEKQTVLIAEDDYYSRDILQQILEEHNQQVIVAKNGEEAVNLATELTNISIVLMDMRMPEKNGYEATRDIRKKHPKSDLPIYAITAEVFKEERDKMIESGCNGFIGKPIEENELLKVLTNHIPYKKRDSDPYYKPISTTKGNSLSELISDQKLKTEFDNLNNTFFIQADQSMQLDKWKYFLQELNKITEKYKTEELTNFSKTMKLALDNFDIKLLQKLINEYKNYITLNSK